MPDQTKKNFANLHYPGMKSDPNEGTVAFDPNQSWRFDEQIKCIGEEAQRKLATASCFVTDTSPLGVRVAKKLLSFGIGRVGIFGEQPARGAAELAKPAPEDVQGTLPVLTKQVRAEFTWAQFETFREASIDRQMRDMVRGFDFLIACGDGTGAGQALELARELGLSTIIGAVAGKTGWCASVPAGSTCEDCIEHPVFEQQTGLYFPLLDVAATWIATVAVESFTIPQSRGAFIESFDATHAPWMRETRELGSKPGCKKCSEKK